jgi:hypothetical protein
MATHAEVRKLQKLEVENKRLRDDNKALRQQLTKVTPTPRRPRMRLRSLAVVLLISIAVSVLVVGNLLFWAGNTIVKTDRYTEATAPLIRDPAIQHALAVNVTEKLFTNVDIEAITQSALPPRAEFLAPTLAAQTKSFTQTSIEKIIQRPQFQERWNEAQRRAHERFITLVGQHGSDGAIDLSEVYTDLSKQLQGTKLAFLADRPLPAKVGNYQLVSGDWLQVLQRTIQNIDTWRIIALGLLFGVSSLAVWLSARRRRTVITLACLWAGAMFTTILSIRIGREVVTSQADSIYSEAVRQAYSIIMRPLVVQSITILYAALLVALIAWISGPSRSSRAARTKVEQLFSGKLHTAIFSHGENSFTNWVGRHKTVLQWIIVTGVAITALFVRLTPTVIFWQLVILLLLQLIVEVLAAKPTR